MSELLENAGTAVPQSELATFNFNGMNVRTKVINSEPWFVAKDVAEILGYCDTSAMARRLDEDEKTTLQIPQVGSNYTTNIVCINESGLYNAIIGSNKPEAKAFKKWVTGEVLPSIRKHGAYSRKQTQSNCGLLTDCGEPAMAARLSSCFSTPMSVFFCHEKAGKVINNLV